MTMHSPLADSGKMLDLVVVGAGPAGMAAAARAAGAGLSVTVLDEGRAPGGQIWRGVSDAPAARAELLGPDYVAGGKVAAAFSQSGATYLREASVWSLFRAPGHFEVSVSVAGGSRVLLARHVLLATGAMERPFPIPGWTLPGVMTAGAAQIAMKSSGLVPAGRTALVGCGPLLYLLGMQLVNAGAPPVAMIDTSASGAMVRALRHLPGFLASPLLPKGLSLMVRLRRRVPIWRAGPELRIQGDSQAAAVSWHGGQVAVDHVLLHQGVVPSLNLTIAAGCQIHWDARQRCFVPRLDDRGQSSVRGLYIAGDGGGIAGASAAGFAGQLAAEGILQDLGLGDARRLAAAQRCLKVARRGRAFLDVAFAPQHVLPPDDETIVCRCEAISAADVRAAARLGVPGPNQLKAFLRCGMGPCQGRQCGLIVTELLAAEQRRSAGDVGYLRTRFPVKPLRLAELAGLPADRAAHVAVTGHPPKEGPQR